MPRMPTPRALLVATGTALVLSLLAACGDGAPAPSGSAPATPASSLPASSSPEPTESTTTTEISTTTIPTAATGATTTTTTATTATTTTTLPLASPTAVTRITVDAAYAALSPAQVLDLYMPVGVSNPALVAFIHGGAWFTGDKRGPLGIAAIELFVARGYAVASVNYRLSGEALFPAQLLDVKAAIRWLRANAPVSGYDADRIVVVGESAGAHLAALLGTTSGLTQFDDPALGNAGVSSAVQAVVDFYGPVDLLATPAQLDANATCTEGGRVPGELDPAIEGLLGAPATDVPELASAANPITYVSAQVPPFLIMHGDADCVVPYQASVALDEAIARVAGPDRSTLVIVPGSGHYLDFDFESQLSTLLDFLAATVGRDGSD